MKIHAVTERNKSFVWSTTGKAFEALGPMLGGQSVVFDYTDWVQTLKSLRLDGINDVDIVIFESVYLEWAGLTVEQLRKVYPNAKVVCLGSDTIYYITENVRNGCQILWPEHVDLFLEKMDVCIDNYKARGVNVDSWMWTSSQWLLDYCSQFKPMKPEWDCIGVYAPHTIAREGSYRNEMVKYLRGNGIEFTQGGGEGHSDNALDRLCRHYCRSYITLGTTSHDNPKFHGMKGFRDWIGPIMGSMLIYDNYPDVIKKFNDNDTIDPLVPIYEYGNFQQLVDLINFYKKNFDCHAKQVQRQREWAKNHTIEKQLAHLFVEHGII